MSEKFPPSKNEDTLDLPPDLQAEAAMLERVLKQSQSDTDTTEDETPQKDPTQPVRNYDTDPAHVVKTDDETEQWAKDAIDPHGLTK